MNVKDKKIVVFGLARSGAGAANLLAYMGAQVTVTDKKSETELSKYTKNLLPSIKLSLGGHPDELIYQADIAVISPGVSLDIAPLKKARGKGIKIIGELELAFQIINQEIPFFAITGTNGKSTTTTLLDLMFKNAGVNSLCGGNIGNALTEELFKMLSANKKINSTDCIVAEVSNFQLDTIETFRPKGAVILNITPDHLDRYKSMDEYRDSKAMIFLNQRKEDYLVLNADDAETMNAYKGKIGSRDEKTFPDIFFFSRKEKVKGLYFKDGFIFCNLPEIDLGVSDNKLISAEEIKIKGVHNLENAMAASAMALLAKCPANAVVKTLREFAGLEHRLEFVRELEGVTYINDSKGTNVGAVEKSLEGFSKPVILIAGGRDKAGDFSVLRKLVREKVKTLVLIGEARGKIKKALGNITDAKFADTLMDAVIISRNSASKGDVVLLSPACASFDMFKSFEDRGEQFKKIVKELA
ncbi:MAG: UDP-N-acetylmuramoyl-L-alanine--D-glutamate ligase [Nitrospiraceae bacterium]|nr:UDP-N-acetylmuramoyl-L-alanine--D-glutamate ligase [Nitrospiraceae bacterium]